MYIVQLTDNDFKVINLENKYIVCIQDLIEFSDGGQRLIHKCVRKCRTFETESSIH